MVVRRYLLLFYSSTDCYSKKFLEVRIFYFADPSQWSNDYPDCGGEHQSPININSSTVVRVDFPQFTFLNYDKVFPETVTNNGHTSNINKEPPSTFSKICNVLFNCISDA